MPRLDCITIFEAGSFGSDSGTVVIPTGENPFPNHINIYPTVGTAAGTGTAVGDASVLAIGSAAGTGAATATGSTGAPSDPNFADVKLLLDMQGTNGGTTFTNLAAGLSHTITRNGTVTDTSQFKFGTSSGFFDGSNDDLEVLDNLSDFDQGTAFTHEGWFRFNSVAGDHVLFSNSATPGSFGSFLRLTGGSLDWFNWSTGQHFSNAWAASTGVWYHVAVCRDGTTTRMFVDGNALSTTNTGSQSFSSVFYIIGAQGVASRPFNGWCGAFRWTKGVGRYTSNFTPPSAPFPTS